ncbi:MAG: AraC family transcriptional regulator [Bradyrhizobium sp.]|jgi:AraC family transcriptional regulator|nr:AraC family transcriptional regulator [Bradyrhizobium sp.]
MNPAQKALWYIESHLAKALTLDEVAAIAGVSRFHMVRAFAAATGLSVMRYVRARRLSEAARALAGGAPDILSVALDADYGSHEAFTRAFRERFGVTPETVRGSAQLENLQLQEPITMDSTAIDNLQPPRFETGKPLLVAGIGERYTWESGAAIPGQWQRFRQKVDEIPDRVGKVAYGVCCNGDDSGNFDYIAGVEVSDFSNLPREFSRVRIPEARYAVFSHKDHISTIRRTVNTIWNHWLPASRLEAADAPSFERYGENFDPLTGNGGLEIWVPVRE